VIAYPATVVAVIDGDSLKVRVDGWPAPFDPIEIRIKGVDTPEHVRPPAKSACEVRLGLAARAYARTLVRTGDTVTVVYTPGDRDKYLRVLAAVTLPDGRDWGQTLLAAHMARAYGGGTKTAWCAGGRPLP
jgi:micrococcal nuclease